MQEHEPLFVFKESTIPDSGFGLFAAKDLLEEQILGVLLGDFQNKVVAGHEDRAIQLLIGDSENLGGIICTHE